MHELVTVLSMQRLHIEEQCHDTQASACSYVQVTVCHTVNSRSVPLNNLAPARIGTTAAKQALCAALRMFILQLDSAGRRRGYEALQRH
jgi:hypothetical protein